MRLLNIKVEESQQTNKFLQGDFFFAVAYLVVIILVYIFLHGIYRPQHPDDPWFFSYIYNHFVKGTEYDVCVGSIGYGYDGVTLFGKTFTYLYGTILNSLGWTRSNAQLVSTVIMGVTAVIWWAALVQLGFSQRLCIFFSLTLMIVEPFFGAANQIRPDALCLFLISASLLLFLHHKYVISAFLALVAFEVHPVGIVSFIYMSSAGFSQILSRSSSSKKTIAHILFQILFGIALGILYYIALHHRYIALLPSVLTQTNTFGNNFNNFLTMYFFKARYIRHLPELSFIIICTAWFIKKRYYRENSFITTFALVSLVFAIIIRRPNPMYIIYIYPAFLLMILWIFDRENHLKTGCVLILFYLLPQYTFVYMLNHNTNISSYLDSLQRIIPSDSTTIVGRLDAFYTFKDRRFFSYEYREDIESLKLDMFYLLEDDNYRKGIPSLRQFKKFADAAYKSEQIGSFSYLGETYVVRKFVRQAINGLTKTE